MTPLDTARTAAMDALQALPGNVMLDTIREALCDRYGDRWRFQDALNTICDGIEQLEVDERNANDPALRDYVPVHVYWPNGFVEFAS